MQAWQFSSVVRAKYKPYWVSLIMSLNRQCLLILDFIFLGCSKFFKILITQTQSVGITLLALHYAFSEAHLHQHNKLFWYHTKLNLASCTKPASLQWTLQWRSGHQDLARSIFQQLTRQWPPVKPNHPSPTKDALPRPRPRCLQLTDPLIQW